MASASVKFIVPVLPGQQRNLPLDQTLKQISDAINATTVASLVTIYNTPYNASGSNVYILADATAGAITINLPLAADIQAPLFVVKIDASANAVSLVAQAGQLISGAATIVLAAQYDKQTVISDRNSLWYTVS